MKEVFLKHQMQLSPILNNNIICSLISPRFLCADIKLGGSFIDFKSNKQALITSAGEETEL